jgi:hypothetical protein
VIVFDVEALGELDLIDPNRRAVLILDAHPEIGGPAGAPPSASGSRRRPADSLLIIESGK